MSTTAYDALLRDAARSLLPRRGTKTRSKRSHAAGFTQLLETLRVACFPVGVRYRRRT
ncbi:hypothetical protein [Nostoc sp.]|uniref:hypothetical protein n=1 Tax=Nostoc sp. TaxID=1180 RepID=UPI002FFCD5C6